jgi:hypothetical protein
MEAGRPDTAVTGPPPGFPPSLRPGCLKPDGQPNIFCPGDDGYGCYKIPTMLHHSSGVLLALVEARKYSCDDHGYVDLRLRRSSDSGRSWGPSLLVHGNSTEDHWTTVGDANVVEDARTGVVWMVHTRNNSRLFLSHSTTAGLSWSPPRDVTAELRRGSSGGGTGHAGGIQLSGHGPYAGRLLIPVYSSAGSYTVYSDTHGMSWRAGAAVPQPKGEAGADEWAIAESGAFTSDGTPILRECSDLRPLSQRSKMRWAERADQKCVGRSSLHARSRLEAQRAAWRCAFRRQRQGLPAADTLDRWWCVSAPFLLLIPPPPPRARPDGRPAHSGHGDGWRVDSGEAVGGRRLRQGSRGLRNGSRSSCLSQSKGARGRWSGTRAAANYILATPTHPWISCAR